MIGIDLALRKTRHKDETPSFVFVADAGVLQVSSSTAWKVDPVKSSKRSDPSTCSHGRLYAVAPEGTPHLLLSIGSQSIIAANERPHGDAGAGESERARDERHCPVNRTVGGALADPGGPLFGEYSGEAEGALMGEPVSVT